MTHASLFSGIGGFDLAAEWMGWENLFTCEIDEFCTKVLKYHFKNSKHYGDITKTDFNEWKGKIDVLTGGFPCQDISIAGLQYGIHGSKSGLWVEFNRVIKETNPRYVVIENSPQIFNKGFEKILFDLSESGYDAEWQCLCASDYEMLINFYNVCRNNFEELQSLIQSSLYSESDFYKAKDIYNSRCESTNIEKAWALWYLSRQCHAGSLHGGWRFCNGTAGTHVGKVFSHKKEEFNYKLHERLSEVQISCRDALKVITDRDKEFTFYYLDPPYPGAAQGHYYGYSEEDLNNLIVILSDIKGKFILSNYWSKTLRSAVNKYGWNYKEIAVNTRSGMNTVLRKSTEVLVYNFDIEPTLF